MSEKSPYVVPTGRYRGKIESAALRESLKEGTPFYDCVCVITDDAIIQGRPVRGMRLPWSGFLKQEGTSAVRTMRSMIAAGCMFPGDDFENFEGLGTKDVELDVEEEEPYTPEASEQNPDPKTAYRSRVAWVNPLVRGMASRDIDTGVKKALSKSLLTAMKVARSGGGSNSTEPGATIPKGPDGKPVF